MLRLTGEALAQHRILGGDTDRAGVQMTLAHHDAAFDHQRRGGETELIGTEQGADDDVATGLHLTVNLNADTRTQAVEHQGCWVSARPSSHGEPACLMDDTGKRPVPPIVTGDHDVIGLGLGDTGGNRADTDFDTSFLTEMDALELAFFRSWISWARSSME